jgi:hypothetical protein
MNPYTRGRGHEKLGHAKGALFLGLNRDSAIADRISDQCGKEYTARDSLVEEQVKKEK